MVEQQKQSMVATIKDSFLAAVITFITAGPMMGLVLDGYTIKSHLIRPLILALVVFFGRTIFVTFLSKRKVETNKKTSINLPKIDFSDKRFLVGIVLCGLLMPFIIGKYWLTVLILCLIYVLLGLGLNIVVGLAGLLDLGFVAFYAVGAYGFALLYQHFDIGFWTAIPLAGLIAACFGGILGFPVLRMHGDYLAIVTLGFGEIIHLILTNWIEFTGGPNGLKAPLPTLFGLEFRRSSRQGGIPFHEFFGIEYSSNYRYMFIYFSLFLVSALLIYFVSRLKVMPIGRAWEALREDEIACRSLGINHVWVKLSAFSLGAMVGGIAGVFFAGLQGFIDPLSFTFFESALILAIVVLGGMGSTPGVIIAAIVLTSLPEFLREFSDFRVLIFGILMVVMMIWRPGGLIKPKREIFNKNLSTQ